MVTMTKDAQDAAGLTTKDVVSVNDVAKALGMTEISVRRWIGAGQIPSLKVGLRRFVRRDVLEAMQSRTALVAPRPGDWETAEDFIRLNRPDLYR